LPGRSLVRESVDLTHLPLRETRAMSLVFELDDKDRTAYQPTMTVVR
jgi:hypothetical protein